MAEERISQAEAVVIGAGAGLSAAAGLDYSGSEFRKEFSDYIRKYGFSKTSAAVICDEEKSCKKCWNLV